MTENLQKRIDTTRRMIDGCLNRIATTDNINEIEDVFDSLVNVHLCNFTLLNQQRINGEEESDIEILQKAVQVLTGNDTNMKLDFNGTAKAIQNLMKENQELKEQNKIAIGERDTYWKTKVSGAIDNLTARNNQFNCGDLQLLEDMICDYDKN